MAKEFIQRMIDRYEHNVTMDTIVATSDKVKLEVEKRQRQAALQEAASPDGKPTEERKYVPSFSLVSGQVTDNLIACLYIFARFQCITRNQPEYILQETVFSFLSIMVNIFAKLYCNLRLDNCCRSLSNQNLNISVNIYLIFESNTPISNKKHRFYNKKQHNFL